MHIYNAESNLGFNKGRHHYITPLSVPCHYAVFFKILSSGALYTLKISLHLFSFKNTYNKTQS